MDERVAAPVTPRVLLKEPEPVVVSAPEMVSAPAFWAETVPHCKPTPYMLMDLPLWTRMRYFIEVPDGWLERSTDVSPYRLVPSSSVVPS